MPQLSNDFIYLMKCSRVLIDDVRKLRYKTGMRKRQLVEYPHGNFLISEHCLRALFTTLDQTYLLDNIVPLVSQYKRSNVDNIDSYTNNT